MSRYSPENMDGAADHMDEMVRMSRAADAAQSALSGLSFRRATSAQSIAVHAHHAKRGYVGTVVIALGGNVSTAKVSYTPAAFRNAIQAARSAYGAEA